MPEIVAEWAAEEAWNEELGGAPVLSSSLHLRRLRGKQPSVGDWRRVAPGPWGRAVQEAEREEEGEEPEKPMDVEKSDAEAEGEAETEEEQPKKRARTEFCLAVLEPGPAFFRKKEIGWAKLLCCTRARPAVNFVTPRLWRKPSKYHNGRSTSHLHCESGRKQAGRTSLMQP